MRTAPEPNPASRAGRILRFIRKQGDLGATDREIANALGIHINKVNELRLRLWNQEFIGYSGQPRPHKAVAWMALPADFYDPKPRFPSAKAYPSN